MGKIKLGRFREFMYTMYTHKSRVFKFSLGIKVPNEHWDDEKKTIRKSLPRYDQVDTIIRRGMSEMIDATMECRRLKLSPTVDNVRAAFESLRSEEEKNIFFTGIPRESLENKYNDFLVYKEKTKSKNHLDNLKQCKRVALEFEETYKKSLLPPLVSKEVITEFIDDFLIGKKGYQDGTVEKHISSLKNFLNWAYPGEEFKYINYAKPRHLFPIFVKESELEILKSAILYGRYPKTRDLFLFLCYTGMRFGDSQVFHTGLIEDGVIEYIQKKTSSSAVVPLKRTVKSIINRYGGTAPRMSNQKFDNYLKELFTKLNITRKVKTVSSVRGKPQITVRNLNEIISSHIGRKTFITISLMKGIPLQDVMKMSGHSDYRAMKPYIELSKIYLKDSASRWDD